LPVSGAETVVKVRNKLVHPKESLYETLYKHEGIVREAWQLTLEYLMLIILWDIGYLGSYQRISKLDRWHGQVEPMPWSRDDQ
jgi:hypothetical protein